MAHVEAVWDRLEFRTPWSRAREHGRVRSALERFLRWHYANPRRLLGTEEHFATEVGAGGRRDASGSAGTPTASSSTPTGRSSSSTSSPAAPPERQVGARATASSRSTSTPSTTAPSTELVAARRRPASGGAELVQLGRLDDSIDALVQPQPVHAEDGPERDGLRASWPAPRRTSARRSSRPRPAPHCKDCPFVPVCPAQSAGAVLSQ